MTREDGSVPFSISIASIEIERLRHRLQDIRWPNTIDDLDESRGVSTSAVRAVVDRWLHDYEWPRVEAELNEFSHATADIDGLAIHHIHQRGVGSNVPILLLHGWPDSFLRFVKVVPRLVVAGHDVVVPSLPGFMFSDQPVEPLTVESTAEIVHALMSRLGHERYAVHGGDWGSVIAEAIASTHPDAVAALHLTDIPFHHLFTVDRGSATDAEQRYFSDSDAWSAEATYFGVQSSDATTLAYGLADSPIGLAAWLFDKYRAWASSALDIDDVITQATLMWHTNTIWSSMRLYSEGFPVWDTDGAWAIDPASSGPQQGAPGELAAAEMPEWSPDVRLDVPTAFAIFPDDIGAPPREYAERFFQVERFTVMPAGGHFAALEQPALLATDLIEFLASTVVVGSGG